MGMQVDGNHDYFRTEYAERVKEKQAAGRPDKEEEKNTEGKSSGKLSAQQDEYISSERSGKKSAGLYRVGQDENGNRKIYFDDPKADHAGGKENQRAVHVNEEEGLKAEEDRSGESKDDREPTVSGNSQEKPEEKCVTDTDRVDREIRNLKEKKQQLKQQIRSASGDEKKIRELEKSWRR